MPLLLMLLISTACALAGFYFGRVTSHHRREIEDLGEARARISSPVIAPIVDVRAPKRAPMPSHASAPIAH